MQLALVREQAPGEPEATLKAARAAARKALRSGKLSAGADRRVERDHLAERPLKTARRVQDTYRQQRARAVSLARAQGAEYQFAYANAGPSVHIENFYSTAANPRAPRGSARAARESPGACAEGREIAVPAGRFHLAFGQPSLTWAPDVDTDRLDLEQPRHELPDRPWPLLRARPHRHRPRDRPDRRPPRDPRPHQHPRARYYGGRSSRWCRR